MRERLVRCTSAIGSRSYRGLPNDKRVGRGVYFWRAETANQAGEIYVLTHVDITPDHLDDGLKLLKDMTV
jgi:hypothetical protein